MIALWKKWSRPPLPKRKLDPPQKKGPKKFEIFQARSNKTQKCFSPPQKNIGDGGVYTMENTDNNTGYQEVVRVED